MSKVTDFFELNKFFQANNKIKFAPIIGGSNTYVTANLYKSNNHHLVVVAASEASMYELAENISFFVSQEEIAILPAWDSLPYDKVSPTDSILSKRISSLYRISTSSSKLLIITNINSILQRSIPKSSLLTSTFQLKVGDKLKFENLIRYLIDSGFNRVDIANSAGEFAIRGSIIDIVKDSDDLGIRIDFFGEVIESIRRYDLANQVTVSRIDNIYLHPSNEIIFSDESVKRFQSNYQQKFGVNLNNTDVLYESISNKRKYPGMEYWLPFFYEKLETIFDYIKNPILIFEYGANESFSERLKVIEENYQARKNYKKELSFGSTPYNPTPPELLWLTEDEWQTNINKANSIKFSPFIEEDSFSLPIKPIINFTAVAHANKKSIFDVLKENILESRLQNNKEKKKNLKYMIACYSVGSRERLQNMLEHHNIHSIIVDSWEEHSRISGKTIGLIVLPLNTGFENEDFAIISEQDFLGVRLSKVKKENKRIKNFLSEAASLIEGEYVVHNEHGIGRFEGLETLTINNEPHDCLKIIYDGGDKLYVPVENIDVITRYGSEENVTLDKLGGLGWQQRKARLKDRIKLAAEELLKVAAERETQFATPLIPLPGLYEEFCAQFPYAETDDQLSAIEQVEKDLASGKPMDRLICGDVGFGKTEIALRAAFMAAFAEGLDQKPQIAVVVPTTLLARQHYKTFKERFAKFQINIKQLSRLVTPKEAKETKKQLENGDVDIIIGTHAVLAKNIQFHNLGLLIIDEEQHFGVGQKERLKQLKANIHVLTLSATPIPRTLQMSLVGIRELSLLATPPVDRLATKTYVMPFDPIIIREAILREYYRGGRCFYVVPRISDLKEVEETLRALVPEIKIVVAHGQMPAQTLDEIMSAFYDGTYDLLLSTTIVESGLDVPSANTMIIHRSDKFGLAQLYQLRGRVGRGKVKAYAYLTLHPRIQPSKTALRRLEVMQSLDSLGAGFSLASHDMDIRGFGNLVGEEQSGHIKEVGIELYQEMLREAIENLNVEVTKGFIQEKESWSPQINVGLSVQIPENYVKDLSVRMGLYRRIASLTTEQEVEALAAEMIDRFGPLPIETNHLLSIVKLKQLCLIAHIEKIDAGPKGILITFKDNKFPNPDALLDYVFKNPISNKIRPDQKLLLIAEFDNAEERLKYVQKAISNIVKLVII
jgi:transcription-repair coupling factor (superfamily II helicase)